MTIGPKVTVNASCFECQYCRTKGYSVQGDSGSEVYCNEDGTGTLRHIGDTNWDTPIWCRFRVKAIAEALNAMNH